MGDFLGTLRHVSFGLFTLDSEARQLLIRGPKKCGRYIFRQRRTSCCAFLLETRPRAVSKRELHERLWPATFVSEATLASLVAEAREALGEPRS